jgi:uncharacterized protein YggE
MKFVSHRGLTAARTCGIAMLVIVGFGPLSAFAQSDRARERGFWVAASASVTVPADEGIVIMAIRAAGPEASNALAQNEQITQRITVVLDHLQLQGKYKFSANRFGDASGTRTAATSRAYQLGNAPFSPGLYRPGVPCGSDIEVTKYVLVTFDSSDLADPTFDGMLAATIDSLVHAGAQPAEVTMEAAQTRSSGSVFFTLKDPQPVQLKAIRQATERARAQAEEIARTSGVKLGGIIDARVNRPLELQLPRGEFTVLDEIGLRFYSNSKDAITIPATFAVRYSTKK